MKCCMDSCVKVGNKSESVFIWLFLMQKEGFLQKKIMSTSHMFLLL